MYTLGQICPECGEGELSYDSGEPMTRDFPGDPPHLYCDAGCGFDSYDDVDWDQVNYRLNEK